MQQIKIKLKLNQIFVSIISYHLICFTYCLIFLQVEFGCARQITFEEITLVETRYPILIDQNYGSYYLTVFT